MKHHVGRDRELWRELKRVEGKEDEILRLLYKRSQVLSFVKIRFGGCMAEGPVTLIVGRKTVATVDAFDQNGAPFTGTIPTPSWSIDNQSFDSIAVDPSNPNAEDVTSLAAGVANLTLTVQGPNGPLTDTEQVINQAQAPVLSSVKINFSTPQ